MEIFINDTAIDFRLEEEQTFPEVLEGVSAWIEKEGFIPAAIRLNGRALDPGSELPAEPVETIQRIEIDAVQSGDLARQVLGTLHQYLTVLARSFGVVLDESEVQTTTADSNLAVDALTEYRYARDSLRSFLSDVLGTTGTTHFENLDRGLAALANEQNPADAVDDDTKVALTQTIGLCRSRLQEMEDPERELAAVMGLLHGMIPAVREVPVQLQTGKDLEAMSTVVRFTELTGRMLRILPSVDGIQGMIVDDVRLDAHIQSLNEILNELSGALESEDTILIGDLLEYEIVERIQSLIDAVNARQ